MYGKQFAEADFRMNCTTATDKDPQFGHTTRRACTDPTCMHAAGSEAERACRPAKRAHECPPQPRTRAGLNAQAPRSSSRRGSVGQRGLAAHDPEAHPAEHIGDVLAADMFGQDVGAALGCVDLAHRRPDVLWSWTRGKTVLKCLTRPNPPQLPITAPPVASMRMRIPTPIGREILLAERLDTGARRTAGLDLLIRPSRRRRLKCAPVKI